MIDSSRIRYLGIGLQSLRNATVAVIGAGGGGSHIAQQLAHLGTGKLVIIDEDVIEASNVNRVVCSSYADIGLYKVTVLERRLRALGGKVVPVISRAEKDAGRAWIEHSDLVMGAVDSVRSRHNIEAICRGALLPYIDIGAKIHVSEDGTVEGIGGQVFVSMPDGPCMECAGIVTDEGMLLDREEYAVGVPDQQVISLNGILASQAVNTALALLTGFAPTFLPPRMIKFDGLLHRMVADPVAEAMRCCHYILKAAGWRTVLTQRLAKSEL